MTDADATLGKLADLITGRGAAALGVVESRMRRFCPFAAVGMERHEIRHSNFLAYMLDPQRPHGLGAAPLHALLMLLADRRDEPDRLSLHFRDLGSARVYRERDHIDLLVEIPDTGGDGGLLLVLEVKIDAGESDGQLARYEGAVRQRYGTGRWRALYGFLTPHDGREAQSGKTEKWAPLTFTDLLTAIEHELDRQGLRDGRGAEMFRDYHTMMRRHGMAKGTPDAALDAAVKEIWAHHAEALEYLWSQRPDPVGAAFSAMRQETQTGTGLIEKLSAAFGSRIAWDTSCNRYRRFQFAGLLREYPFLVAADTKWLKSRSLMFLELQVYGGAVNGCIVVRAPEDAGSRRTSIALRTSFAEMSGTRADMSTGEFRHFFSATLISRDEVVTDDAAGDLLVERLTQFVGEVSPKIKIAVEGLAVADNEALQSQEAD